MPTTVQGVVSRTRGAPVELLDVVVPDPGPGEVVVDVAACGVCRTDLHYASGAVGDDYPFLLGHEAAGTVAAVGEGVTQVRSGLKSSGFDGAAGHPGDAGSLMLVVAF